MKLWVTEDRWLASVVATVPASVASYTLIPAPTALPPGAAEIEITTQLLIWQNAPVRQNGEAGSTDARVTHALRHSGNVEDPFQSLCGPEDSVEELVEGQDLVFRTYGRRNNRDAHNVPMTAVRPFTHMAQTVHTPKRLMSTVCFAARAILPMV
jgi:hypothetical protein